MPTGPLPDTWQSRDFPALIEIARRMHANAGAPLDPQELAEPLGMDPRTLQSALHALNRRGLIEVEAAPGGGENPILVILNMSADAYFLTGLHPDADDALTGLIQLLEQAEEQTTDEDQRTRLRRAADALAGVSRDVMVGVLTVYASKYGVPH